MRRTPRYISSSEDDGHTDPGHQSGEGDPEGPGEGLEHQEGGLDTFPGDGDEGHGGDRQWADGDGFAQPALEFRRHVPARSLHPDEDPHDEGDGDQGGDAADESPAPPWSGSWSRS
jgi:hypothetical protein